MDSQKAPKSRKCCFCVPMVNGLLTWGYFKLILLILAVIAFYVYVAVICLTYDVKPMIQSYLIIGGFTLYSVIEIAFTMILVIAVHAEHARMLRIYSYYSVVNSVLLSVIFVTCMWLPTADAMEYPGRYDNVSLLAIFVSTFIYLVLNIYITVLVHSKVTTQKNTNNRPEVLDKTEVLKQDLKVPV